MIRWLMNWRRRRWIECDVCGRRHREVTTVDLVGHVCTTCFARLAADEDLERGE